MSSGYEIKPSKEQNLNRRRSEIVLQNLDLSINGSGPTETILAEYLEVTSGRDSLIAAVTPNVLRQLIVSEENVPIKTFMIAAAGLPGCDKSQPLMKMLNEVVSTLQTATRLGVQQKDDGVVCYELAAIGKPLTQLEQPKYSETTKSSCYLYAFESALKYYYMQNSQLVWKFDDPSPSDHTYFKDEELNKHFCTTFQRLNENHRNPSLSLQWMKRIPSSFALFNIWDVKLSKSVLHFLPALWGHLDRSHMWLFLNLDFDIDSLFELPDSGDDKCHVEHIMRYRTRLHYFLRYAMLLKSKRYKDREDVCSIFGMHKKEIDKESIDHLEDELTNAATQMNIDKLIDTGNIRLLQPNKDDMKVLKRKLDSIVNKTLASPDVIPL